MPARPAVRARLGDATNRRFEIRFLDPGMQVYSFTFG
ncbi:MAG: hypothetical protein ACREUT_05545 [Steroidobacteraceae bacterium]